MATPDRIRLYTLDEAADFLAVSTRTLRRKIETGELAAHKFGRLWRIAYEDLVAFLDSHRKA